MASYDDTATVSGTVVSIENGADEVGAKSCVVTVSPTLTGTSLISETQTGRNLLPNKSYLVGANTLWLGDNSSPYYQPLKAGTYTVSLDTSETMTILIFENGSWIDRKYNATTATFVIDHDGSFAIQLYKSAGIPVINNWQLELGSTAHDYEPYQTSTTYTASLGCTIYGGEVDIVNGVGTDGYIKYVIDGVNNYAVNISGTNFNIMPYGLNIDGTINKWLCDAITASSTNFGYNSNQGFIFIRQAGWSSLSGVTDVASFNAYCQEHPITLILPLATPTDFTFTGQEVPTRLGYNAFWSEQGNTELTYYKDGYGFTSVTVNKTGKNLWSSDKDLSITRDKTMYMRIPRGTYTLSFDFVSSTASPVPSYMQVAYSTTDGTKYNPVTVVEGRCSRTFTLSADARNLTIYSSTSYSASVGVTTVVNNIQLEVGSQASSYEPYEAVTKTAKLHKVIYGGQADVVKGTCKPKNLFDDSTFPRTISATSSYYASFQSVGYVADYFKIPTIHIEPDVAYVLSFNVECNTEPFNASVGIGIGYYSRDIASVNNNTSGRISVPFTLTSALKEQYGDILSFRVPRYSSTKDFTFTISNVQLEKGSSATDYAPYFEPFTFPPISMSTDEGENTLFANEGDSAITYRKAVD